MFIRSSHSGTLKDEVYVKEKFVRVKKSIIRSTRSANLNELFRIKKESWNFEGGFGRYSQYTALNWFVKKFEDRSMVAKNRSTSKILMKNTKEKNA